MRTHKKIEKRSKDVLREVKRNSINRERISNAGIIGLYVLFGNEVVVKTPSKSSYQTLPHLKIENTMVGGESVIDYVKRFVVIDENKDSRSKEAYIMNAVSSTFHELLGGKQTKKKEAKKSVKLLVFENIEPFNKIGFKLFAEKVINVIFNIPVSGHGKREQTIVLKPFDDRIVEIVREVSINHDNLTENGIQIINMIFSQIDACKNVLSQQCTTDAQNQFQIGSEQVDPESYEIANEMAFWYYQKAFEESCKQCIEALSTKMKTHTEYIDSISCINLPGLSSLKNSGINELNQSLQCIANELETISNQFHFSQQESSMLVEKLNNLITHQPQGIAKMKKELVYNAPLHLNSIVKSFQRMFSECDLQLAANREMMKVVENAQQQKLLNDVGELMGNENNSYLKKDLKRILQEEGRTSEQLPIQLEKIFLYLIDSCCEKELILGNVNEQENAFAREILLRFDEIEFEGLPPLVVCDCLKMFLKQLPNHLINSFSTKYIITQWVTLKQPVEYSTYNKAVKQMLNSCSTESVTVLKALLKLCTKIESMSDINKMNVQLISESISPCLFDVSCSAYMSEIDKEKQHSQIEKTTKQQILKEVTIFLIREFKHLFPEYTNELTLLRSQMKELKIENCFGAVEKVVEKVAIAPKMELEPIPFLSKPTRTTRKPQSKDLLEEIQEFLKKKQNKKEGSN